MLLSKLTQWSSRQKEKVRYDQSRTLSEQKRDRDKYIYSYQTKEHSRGRLSKNTLYWMLGGSFLIIHFFMQWMGVTFINVLRGFGRGKKVPFQLLKALFGGYYSTEGFLITFVLIAVTWLFIYKVYRVQRSTDDAADELIEDDLNSAVIEDPHILPEKFDYVFDNKVWRKGYDKDGNTIPLSVTCLISHMALKDYGSVRGRDGKVKFDKNFMEKIFNVAEVHEDERIYYDSKKLRYNPKNIIYGKSVGDTLADSINATAYVPDCEDPDSQDPSGIYIVSTDPENTIVVTETRGGKGQKFIEPMIDIWSRLFEQPNIVATDLKMELLRKCLRTLTLRGYNVKSLNMLVPAKTDVINFLGYAVDSAVRGDIDEMEATITTIADIYFPKDAGNDNPMWQNAASAVFKRTAMGLIDYIYEEVAELKHDAKLTPGELRQMSDELYGKVTLFNAYKFVVTTSSTQYTDQDFINIDPEAENVDSKTGMTLFFDATNQLYPNSIRTKIANNDKPIRVVADSERMLASIYGIALFGMIFFTDDRVIKLTSARPSENLDMAGFAYPRRMAVRFDLPWARRQAIINDVAKWSCYEDPEMTKPFLTENGKIDKDFIYDVGTVNTYGWADTVFKGIFPKRHAYIKLELFGADNGLLSHTFNFVFKKDYRKSYSGQQILYNLITHESEVQGGTLSEYTLVDVEKRDPQTNQLIRDERGHVVTEKKVKIVSSHNTVFRKSLILTDDLNSQVESKQKIITDFDIHYTEKPTALFMVAPPNYASYNKILLITIDMLYGKQTSMAYITTSGQKPFYETKYMMDEMGNMQSEGHSISMLDSKMSSGLGQGQQFILILQALKQIDALYGAEKSETIKNSVGRYLIMKTKDESTINTLMGMNGEKFHVQKTSQTNDKPIDMFFANFKAKGSLSETRSRDITNVLSKNDFLRMNDKVTDGRAIVVSGGNPVVSAGSTILPMASILLSNRTGGDGKDISVQNPPVMASTLEFDPLRNIPDFGAWIKKRVAQARITPKVVERYKQVYGYSDLDLQRLDANIVAAEIMHGVNQNLAITARNEALQEEAKRRQPIGHDFNHNNYEEDHQRDHKRDQSYPNNDERIKDTQRAQTRLENTAKAVDNVMDPSNMDDTAQMIREMAAERESVKRQSDAISAFIGNINEQASHTRQLSDDEAFGGRFDEEEATAYMEARYVDKHLTRAQIKTTFGYYDQHFKDIIADIYDSLIPQFKRSMEFVVRPGQMGPNCLYSQSTGKLFVNDQGNNVYEVQNDFLDYLITFDSWEHLLNGQFEGAIRQWLKQHDEYISKDDLV